MLLFRELVVLAVQIPSQRNRSTIRMYLNLPSLYATLSLSLPPSLPHSLSLCFSLCLSLSLCCLSLSLSLSLSSYLKEFRVDQCKLFLQHKCTQHRPYTCFYWHFMNQRRRRPVRKRDGTFNYSPDIYCSSYDENTGICPNGDESVILYYTS